MRPMLLATTLALCSAPALAQPPAPGTTHTFVDPLFTGTVFCDTFDQVQQIAASEAPGEIYQAYLFTQNARNEPTCAVIIPTGVVLDVRPLGVMVDNGEYFHAWAVETQVGTARGFALYLEHFVMV